MDIVVYQPSIAETLHDFGVNQLRATAKYEMDLYHSYHAELPIGREKTGIENDGHVANVVRGAEVYLAAVRTSGKDPLNYFSKTAKFAQQENFTISDQRRHELDELSLVEVAKWHDAANVIDEITDWDKLIATGGSEGVAGLPQMRITGAENLASQMFTDFVNHDGLAEHNLSEEEKRYVTSLGAKLIKGTEFSQGFGEDKLDTLAIIDQTFAIFNPNEPRLIIGLIEEGRQRILSGEKAPETFKPDFYFGGFIKWRFSELSKVGGPDITTFLDFIEQFRQSNPKQFAKILTLNESEVSKLPKLSEFIEQKIMQKLGIAKSLFPKPGEDTKFVTAFNEWDTNGKKQQMEELCQNYKQNFWK